MMSDLRPDCQEGDSPAKDLPGLSGLVGIASAKTPRQMFYDSHCMNYPDQASPQRLKADSWLPGAGEGRMDSDC